MENDVINDKLQKDKNDLRETLKYVANRLTATFARAESRRQEVRGDEIADAIRLACQEEWRRHFLTAYEINHEETRAAYRRLQHKGLLAFLEERRRAPSIPNLQSIRGGQSQR